ncbi:MAG: hypothetical protein ACRDYY_18785 [Acidimicrobiales bacterium]
MVGLAKFDDVKVAAEGMPAGSVVSLEIGEDGLLVGGYGMLPWAGSRVAVEDAAPQGVGIVIAGVAGAPVSFFVPARSLPEGASLKMLANWLARGASQAGATLDVSLSRN